VRVGVEGIPLFGNRTGVGQYQKRLLEAASQLEEGIDYEVTRQLMPHRRVHDWPIPPNRHLSYHIVRWLPPVIYFQMYKRFGWTLPFDVVLHRKYDAMLFFNFVSYPVSKRTKVITTIHDLSYLHHKEYVSPANQAWLEKFVPKSIRRADKFIAVSENTKREIVEHYKVDPAKIAVITPAVDHEMFKPSGEAEITEAKKKFGITKPYILSVGTLEPRKNLLGVLTAFEALPEETKQNYALVLAGGKGWLDGEIHDKFEALAKQYEVIKTGYVEDADLPALYSGAELFAYPSFYEGFGIPPLEAMACGTPVITANNSSLPEVVGDAAITIDARDTPGLTEHIQRVLSDKNLANELRQKGLGRAQLFSWQKSAGKLAELLKEVVGNG
jgi:glycosyltransferase involved in cell wall biosynthesis